MYFKLALIFLTSCLYGASIQGLSGFMRIPTGYSSSGMAYHRIGSKNSFIYARNMLLPGMEVSFKKTADSDTAVLGIKQALLPETSLTPALAIGFSDLNDSSVEQSAFASMSKKISFLNLTLHAGMALIGKYENADLAGETFEATEVLKHLKSFSSRDKKKFAGLEKTLFGLINLMIGYQTGGICDAGIGINISSVRAEYWQLDIRDRQKLKDNRGFSLSAGYKF